MIKPQFTFPFLCCNIPFLPAYGIFMSHLIRCARACFSYECFILMAARLSYKLPEQGYVRVHEIVSQHYEISLSQKLHDILGHDHNYTVSPSIDQIFHWIVTSLTKLDVVTFFDIITRTYVSELWISKIPQYFNFA